MKEKKDALSYLKPKKVEDVKDELLIMKFSHLLSIPKVRAIIIIIIDFVFFFLVQFGTNAVKTSLSSFKLVLHGEEVPSVLSVSNLVNFKHSLLWYVIVLALIIFIDIKIYFTLYTNYRDINRNQKGSTRWSTQKEIKEQYASIPLKFKYPYETYYGKGGAPISHYGTYKDENNKLQNIEKGVIYIDRSPVNNLVIGITRSGKGEMYVFTVIDIYSRAENKVYYMHYDTDTNNFALRVANIYYDVRNQRTELTDNPVEIDYSTLAFTKKEFETAVKTYEREHNIKPQLPENIDVEETYDLIDSIDNNKITVKEKKIVSTKDKIKQKQNTEKGITIKLTTKKLTIIDKNTETEKEYPFESNNGQSKKNALDQALLYLQNLNSGLVSKYEEYQEALGFAFEEIKIQQTLDDINQSEDAIYQNVTSNETLSKSTVFKSVPEEEIKDGIVEEKKKIDYVEALKDTAKLNGISDFKFKRNYQASLIVSDPKLELFIASKQILEMRGYDVYCLNLINPYESSSYNPLQLIVDTYKGGDPAEASAIARSLATSIFAEDAGNGDNSFFYDNAAFLTAALIMSEVIDEIHADDEANKIHFQEHLEATNRYKNLPEEEKNDIDKMGLQLDELRNKRYSETDNYQIIVLDRQIEELESKLSQYNYKLNEFVPRHDNEKKINLPNVLLKFTMLAEKTIAPDVEGAEPKNALDVFFENRDPLDVARNLYSAIKIAGGEKVKGSVYSTVLSKLTGFMDDKIKKMTAFSTFRLENIGFGERPIAVFMALPDYDTSNSFIQSIFISQVYYALAKKATISGGKCKREVIFLLDEFGNIPAIANMSSMITVCLGRNIRFNLIIQAYSQLNKVYGEHDANTIYGNCGNQIYILTDDNETAEQFSTLIGKETIVNVSRMGSEVALTMQKQYTESTEEKPLLNSNELMEFVEGECVIKRVMMRKDLQNRNIKPRPIYNCEKNKTSFPLRYQYLLDWYDTERPWDSLHADSCAKLNILEYTSDFTKLLETVENYTSPEYQAQYSHLVETYNNAKNTHIRDFVEKDVIKNKLITQIRELSKLDDNQLEDLTLADIEKYYIKYENNLPAFRQRMYECSFSSCESRYIRDYDEQIIDYIGKLYDINDFMELCEVDEESIKDMSIEDLLERFDELEIDENNIEMFKAKIEKMRKDD